MLTRRMEAGIFSNFDETRTTFEHTREGKARDSEEMK